MYFRDRRDAGRKLAQVLERLPDLQQDDLRQAIVLALPRGGVPVGYEVACAFHLPLDILIVRKLGVPDQPELAMGAITSGGTVVMNTDIVEALHISEETIAAVIVCERLEMERQENAYRGACLPLAVEDRSVILVDDGVATGASICAAARAVQGRASNVTIAVPIAGDDACRSLAREADRLVCAAVSGNLGAVGAYYRNFTPTSDDEVRALLAQARKQYSHPEQMRS
jgi:putative phosphoribosyl transferase